MTLQAAIYARSSTNKQGDTIEHQIQMIQGYADRIKLDCEFHESRIYCDEESGFKKTLLQKDMMRKLISDIKAGVIDVVFFKGITRFSRDSGDSIVTSKAIIQQGVRLISLEENYDSKYSDPTYFQIHAVMAESESRKNSVRVSLGNRQKARNGQWAGSVTPMGYSRVKSIKDFALRQKLISEGRHPESLWPDEKADLIRMIFDMYVNQGMGRKMIVNKLNELGHKTRNGYPIHPRLLDSILKDETYTGRIVYGKHRVEYIDMMEENRKKQVMIEVDEKDWAICEDAHPAIVEREVFMKARKIARERDVTKGRRSNNARHPLTGLIKCSKCGHSMICHQRTQPLASGEKTTYRYYSCVQRLTRGVQYCDNPNINAYDIEEYIYDQIKKQIEKVKDDPTFYKNYITLSPNKTINDRINNVEENINRLINKSLALLENKDLYDNQTFVVMNKKIKSEIVELRETKRFLVEELEMSEEMLTEEDIKRKFDEFLELDLNDLKRTREIFHEWINEVKVIDGVVYIDQKFRIEPS